MNTLTGQGGLSAAEEVAFASIQGYLSGLNLQLPDIAPAGLDRPAGAFVTFFDDSGLRGSMGTGRPVQSNAAREIAFNAIQAGVNDPRFEPLVVEDLEFVKIAVDVIGESEPGELGALEGKRPDALGVKVRQGRRLGIVLPWALGSGANLADLARVAMDFIGIDERREYALELIRVEHFGEVPPAICPDGPASS